MVKVLRLAAQDRHPELRAVVTGLSVAGVEGSLRTRFFDDASLAGRGVVRAKTGTLRKVHTLAGTVRTSDGSVRCSYA
jgi:D-alanyl-D-alanine carboxypeptidase/D-alanyl-D-alanine-endopeptidase (penicillin-binding protein 4)